MKNLNVIELSADAMAALLDTKPTMTPSTRAAIEKFGAIFETDGVQYRTARTDFTDGPTHRTEFPIAAAVPLDPSGSN